MKFKEPPWLNLGIKMRMGLKSLNHLDWLPLNDAHGPDGERFFQMQLKKKLREKHKEKIFIALPEAYEASEELVLYVKNYFKSLNSLPILKQRKDWHPLYYAGFLIPEDLLILEKKNDKWVLTAGSLYFPAHWSLSDKISKKLSSIHDPVPHYKDNLEKAIDKFFDNMIVGPISSRRNWTIQIDNELFVPNRIWDKDLNINQVPRRIFIREEYQTLRKLPKTNSIIFTIRTHLWPISTWENDLKSLNELLDLLSKMTYETIKYRGVEFYGPQLKEWVASLN
tara:strand:+ start:495 stop:1337 length:843 start_codon:yes stop_codon:yes gene_type:complete